jgi:hypothetical protein
MRHDKRTRNVAGKLAFASFEVMVEVSETLANTVSEYDDGVESGPISIFLRNLGVVLAVGRDSRGQSIGESTGQKGQDIHGSDRDHRHAGQSLATEESDIY